MGPTGSVSSTVERAITVPTRARRSVASPTSAARSPRLEPISTATRAMRSGELLQALHGQREALLGRAHGQPHEAFAAGAETGGRGRDHAGFQELQAVIQRR